MIKNGLGMAVNFFCNDSSSSSSRLLIEVTRNALLFLRYHPDVAETLLVDGSANPTTQLKEFCASIGAKYLHTGESLSIVEGYNVGWKNLPYEYVGLMANDVIPHPSETINRLLNMLQKPDVGCVFPYVGTPWSYPPEIQRPGFFGRSNVTCEPSSMALNLVLFKREILELIGGLDDRFFGAYQEPYILLRVRERGYRAVLVGETYAFHYGSLTIMSYQESVVSGPAAVIATIESEREIWRQHYPAYWSDRAFLGIKFWKWPLATTRVMTALWLACAYLTAGKFQDKCIRITQFLEPYLTKYPCKARIKPR